MEKNGGAAFPRGPIGEDCGKPYGEQTGMSLRDYFAGQALAGMNAGYWANSDMSGVGPKEMAVEAYAYADAMLEARK